MHAVISLWPYKPSREEIERLCHSRFTSCDRLKTFHEHIKILSGKQGALFVDPDYLPKHVLLARAKQIFGALCPKEQYRSEFVYHVDQLLLEQLRTTYRENFVAELNLEQMKIGGEGLAAKVDVVWNYEVHNLTDSFVDYPVPLDTNTYSFTTQGLPMEEHIGLREMSASVGKDNDWVDLAKKHKLHSERVIPMSKTKVRLNLSGKAVQPIPPDDFVKVCIKFFYVCMLQDDHTQRMRGLTRNLLLSIDYDEEQFFIDVDDFCMPTKKTLTLGRRYQWDGWLLPHHGVCVEWEPMWMIASPLKKMLERT